VQKNDRALLRRVPLTVLFAGVGAVVSAVVPALFLCFRSFEGRATSTASWIASEVGAAPWSHLFLFVVTTAFLASFGFWLGRKEERLRELAVTDPLTHLFNRRLFHECATIELARAERYEFPLAIVILDIDDLKRVNDSRGHRAGDEALRGVAAAIKKNIRTSDIAARLGGDEFAVLCPQTTSADAHALAERIRVAVGREGGNRLTGPVSVSAGLADRETAVDERIDGILEAADAALYEAKTCGRNCTVVFEKLGAAWVLNQRNTVWEAGQHIEKGGYDGYSGQRYESAHRGGSA
jgi:diguanylate cyclase (GGDEF)-like protein